MYCIPGIFRLPSTLNLYHHSILSSFNNCTKDMVTFIAKISNTLFDGILLHVHACLCIIIMECIISGWRDWSTLHKWWDFTPQISPSNFNGCDFQAPQVRVRDLCGGVWWCIFEPNDDKRVDRSGEKSIWVCVKLVLLDANNTLVSSPVPFSRTRREGIWTTCIGSVSPMQRIVCANQMHGQVTWLQEFYLRFWFMHTRSVWHTFLGDTGLYTLVQTPSLCVHERGLGTRLIILIHCSQIQMTGLRWRYGALTHTYTDKKIHFVICPSHQVCCKI